MGGVGVRKTPERQRGRNPRRDGWVWEWEDGKGKEMTQLLSKPEGQRGWRKKKQQTVTDRGEGIYRGRGSERDGKKRRKATTDRKKKKRTINGDAEIWKGGGGTSPGAKQVEKKAVFQSDFSLWATGFPSDSPTSGTTTASYISASYQPRRRRGLIARAPPESERSAVFIERYPWHGPRDLLSNNAAGDPASCIKK